MKSALNNQCNIVEYLHSPSMIPLIYITKINCNLSSVKTDKTKMYMHRLSTGRKVYLAKKKSRTTRNNHDARLKFSIEVNLSVSFS